MFSDLILAFLPASLSDAVIWSTEVRAGSFSLK